MPCLLIRILEEDELELGSDECAHARRLESIELPAQDLTRGGDDGCAVLPECIAENPDGTRLPWHPVQCVEIRTHDEVAVAGIPGRHRVALDGVHVDVDGEEVVAPLCSVSEHLVNEILGMDALADQPALHVGDRDGDGVDESGLNLLLQRLDIKCESAGHRFSVQSLLGGLLSR